MSSNSVKCTLSHRGKSVRDLSINRCLEKLTLTIDDDYSLYLGGKGNSKEEVSIWRTIRRQEVHECFYGGERY